MKDIFEFSHIGTSLSESDIGTLKDFTNITTRNTGVSKNLTKDSDVLMKQLQSLVFV